MRVVHVFEIENAPGRPVLGNAQAAFWHLVYFLFLAIDADLRRKWCNETVDSLVVIVDGDLSLEENARDAASPPSVPSSIQAQGAYGLTYLCSSRSVAPKSAHWAMHLAFFNRCATIACCANDQNHEDDNSIWRRLGRKTWRSPISHGFLSGFDLVCGR